MPESQTLVLFLGAALALNLTPGPDMLYVAARGSGEGRTSGIVSVLLAAVPLAYDVVRWSGAGRRDREARLLRGVTGGVFVALGLRLAVARRR